MTDSILIIAEAGVNHNGDLELARQLVNEASRANADIVKFQTFTAENLVTPNASKATYQKLNDDATENQLQMLKRLELDREAHQQLFDHCIDKKIEFLSTGFDFESLELLSRLGQVRFKIPSGEITNLPYLRQVGRYGRPIIMSTGMATLKEVEAALTAVEVAGTARDKLTLLHCTTAYPAPAEETNLRAMQTMADTFGVNIGYSDHTLGTEVAIAAAALGATVIEKHITLDRNLPGPDHKASLETTEFGHMVRAIRRIEAALGDGTKQPARSEKDNILIARRSIVAAMPISKGETFTEINITTKRPASGLSPMLWDEIVGQPSPRKFDMDEPIEL
ncbi:MAG: N-acetylneuraminate synthase [bacterium]